MCLRLLGRRASCYGLVYRSSITRSDLPKPTSSEQNQQVRAVMAWLGTIIQSIKQNGPKIHDSRSGARSKQRYLMGGVDSGK